MDFMVGLIKKDFGAFNFIHIRERANKSQFFTLMSFLSKNKRRAGVHDETLLLLVLPDDELSYFLLQMVVKLMKEIQALSNYQQI